MIHINNNIGNKMFSIYKNAISILDTWWIKYNYMYSQYWIHDVSSIDTKSIQIGYMIYPYWIHDVSILDTWCIQSGYMMYPYWIHDLSNLDIWSIHISYIIYPDWIYHVFYISLLFQGPICLSKLIIPFLIYYQHYVIHVDSTLICYIYVGSETV